MFKKIIASLLLFSITANAGLPPTSTKASGDASFFTTFQFEFPAFTRTRSGIKTTFNVLGPTGGGTGLNTFTTGDILYASAANTLSKLAACTTGQVIKFSGGIPTCGDDNGNFAATDWVAYTPTIGAGFGTPTNVSFFWRRMGPNLEVTGSFTSGTIAASIGTLSLPGSLTIDSAKISIANTSGNPGPVIGYALQPGGASFAAMVTATGTSTSLVYLAGRVSNAPSLTPTNVNTTFTSSNVTSFNFTVPISGWTVSGADSEVFVNGLIAYASTNIRTMTWPSTQYTTGTDITYARSTTLGDTFTINSNGAYSINTSGAGGPIVLGITVNGTALSSSINGSVSFAQGFRGGNPAGYAYSGTLNLLAGDVVRIQSDGGGVGGNTPMSHCRITKVK